MTEESLFAAVLGRPPAERQQYLLAACGADEALLQRMQALLAAHERVADIKPGNLAGSPEETGAYAPKNEIGTVIAGKYKLREQIGEGGMGTVWVAEQTQPVRRKVALKLIKAGMDSKVVLSRFEAERQALALMDHPNIAKVLDGGTTENGRPFFVMEYVKGIPIVQYCDDVRLSIPDRLGLFLPVCQAIQHAHQKGIIHRDLKPSNILICLYDGKPVPKVIDFGLAKAMHQQLTEHTLYTAHGLMMGTPLYMSPEQAEFNNLDVDTRTDIYSLGVILYELLTGTTPLDKQRFKKAASQEMLRLIKDEEPPRPSTRLSGSTTLPTVAAQRGLEPVKLTRLIRGELDWIVMKCLEKDRTRRYETANSLARDIQRYLGDEPIEACPPSASYRLRKFVSKHRLLLGTAGTFAFMLIAATTFSAWQAYRAGKSEAVARRAEAEAVAERNAANVARDAEAAARRNAEAQRIQAEANFKKARQAVDEYFTKVSEGKLLNVPGLQPLRKDLLESARKYYQEFLQDHGDDANVRAEAAEAWYRVGFVTMNIGSRQEAMRDFEKAAAMYEALALEHPDVSHYRYKLAMTLNDLGNQQRVLGRTDKSFQSHSRALKLREQVAQDNPTVAEYQKELAIGFQNASIGLWTKGDLTQAFQTAVKSRDIYEQLVRTHPKVADYRNRLAGSFNNIGRRLYEIGRVAEGLQSHRHAAEILEALTRDEPDGIDYQSHKAATYGDIGFVQFRLTNELQEALLSYRKSQGLFEALIRDNPSVQGYKASLSDCHNQIGRILTDLAKPDEALKSHELALAIHQALVRDQPGIPGNQWRLAYSNLYIGKLQRAASREVEGLRSLESSRIIFENLAEGDAFDPYNRACILALCGELTSVGKAKPTPEEQTRRRQYADRAVLTLREATSGGFHNADMILKETDFDSVRSREDFKELMEELRAKIKRQTAAQRPSSTSGR
jgi:serine/threonine protein kinase/tetratricopeptide (TPR) repeat protein